MKEIKAYKGFNKDLKCRGFQYEVGGSYEIEGEVECCGRGFHACQNPLDVYTYYSPSTSRYCEVILSGIICNKEIDKIASSKITIVRELTPAEYALEVEAYLAAGEEASSNTRDRSSSSNTRDRSSSSNTGNHSSSSDTGGYSSSSNTGDHSSSSNTGNRSSSSNTGYQSSSSNTGPWSSSSNTGNYSSSSNTGNYSSSSNTGDQSSSSNTGNYSSSSNTGPWSSSSNTGNYSSSSNTGDQSSSSNTGYQSSSSNTGKDSIAATFGGEGRAKASKGSWIVVTERDEDYKIKCILTGEAGKDIKADTWYTVKDGKFVEVE